MQDGCDKDTRRNSTAVELALTSVDDWDIRICSAGGCAKRLYRPVSLSS